MVKGKLTIENAKVVFRNFSGKGTEFNREGDRNFNVIFDAETGEELANIGWNCQLMKPRPGYEDEPAQFKMQVSIKYGPYPPKIYMVCGRTKTLLDEDSVGILDRSEIETVDLEVRPYNWELKSGKKGTKAYVDTMYVVIKKSGFASKYDFDNEPYNEGDEPF